MFDWSAIDLDPKKRQRVVVAMSGGVDSSVAAVALHEAGFEVIGVTLKLHDAPQARRVGACCAGIDIYDAASVAQSRGFPHYVFDYADRFRQDVVDNFVQSYLRGETPNPCIRCNQSVKFRDLLKAAQDLQADALVTGHYMRRVRTKEGGVQVYRAVDQNKDQSYFLFSTTKQQLQMLRFPLGDLCKKDIRDLAHHYGLDVANKPDSQDICFVGGDKYSNVIERLYPNAGVPGLIRCVVTDKVLGEHKGIYRYTIGQRRGLGISADRPIYVVRIDVDSHTVYVGEADFLRKKHILINELNWLGEEKKEQALEFKIRSTQSAVPGSIAFAMCGTSAIVSLDSGDEGVSAGQACAIYDSMRLMGGGWIVDSTSCEDKKKDWLKGCFSQ